MLEKEVEKYLKKQFEKLGAEVRKVEWIGRRSAPDRVVMLAPNITLWVETKRPGETPRPDQLREHKRMRKAGQTVLVVDTKEQVDELVAQYG